MQYRASSARWRIQANRGIHARTHGRTSPPPIFGGGEELGHLGLIRTICLCNDTRPTSAFGGQEV